MAGRPPKYETPEAMQEKIDDYFENHCDPEYLKDEDGQIETNQKGPIVLNLNAPSLPGLALHLGFASRQSLYDYEKKDQFSYAIKYARSKVEKWVYDHAMMGDIAPAVGIFILKQFGYSDKTEVDIEVKDNPLYDMLNKVINDGPES